MTIKEKYTRIELIGGEWQAVLKVGSQTLLVAVPCSRREASWFRDMLVKALETIIKQEARP